jgi:SRSO17 transposase
VETRQRLTWFLRAMTAELPRKICWSIAKHAGESTPDGMQHLLNRARWDADGVADDMREFVATRLGEHNAVLIADESGDLKKGEHTVGCSASTAAPRVGSRTPGSGSTSPTLAGVGMR